MHDRFRLTYFATRAYNKRAPVAFVHTGYWPQHLSIQLDNGTELSQ